jgi:3-carboxy-cis,cis-muconate cycloisomerase
VSDLLWPGDERAGDLCSDASVLSALVTVEAAWLGALIEQGVAPPEAADDLGKLIEADDAPRIAREAEGGGNPVIPLLGLLRSRMGDRTAATWLHRGLTSQDVLDTALVLCLRDATAQISADLAGQVTALAALADEHRHTELAGRTLTQHAVPITFGLKAAGWLTEVLDARDQLGAVVLPARIGGAAGSLAAPVVLAGSPRAALELVAATAAKLGLATPTGRIPFARLGDAYAACTDAWGHLANDVLLGSRPEIGELSEPAGAGRGGSSAMPQKQNPVLSVLIRRAALTTPALAATLHTAAASFVDERPDGGWHAEWFTLRTLARHTATAASQAAELVTGLRVNPERMAATLAAARPGIDAEQRKLTSEPGPYRGATDEIIDAAIARARA